MKFRKPLLSLLLCLMLGASGAAHAEQKSQIGVVNFGTCVTESKLGKQEQEMMENIKNQMSGLIKDIEEQLKDLTGKLSDSDYLDGLSPEGEQEMKMKYAQLREEYERYQNQFMNVMQQANMKLVQTVSSYVNSATQKIAKAKKLSLVVNKDACFSFDESFEITQLVIEEMDKAYEELQAQAVSKNEEAKTQDTSEAAK